MSAPKQLWVGENGSDRADDRRHADSSVIDRGEASAGHVRADLYATMPDDVREALDMLSDNPYDWSIQDYEELMAVFAWTLDVAK